MVCKIRILAALGFALCAINATAQDGGLGAPGSAVSSQADSAETLPGLARVAVFGFANKTNNGAYDAAAATATGSLYLTLRGLNAYDVIPPDIVAQSAPKGTTNAELAVWCDENRADYAVYGSLEQKKNGNLICRLSSFSRVNLKTTVNKSENDVSLFGIFEATDSLIAQVLESVTGTHIGFGAIAFAREGDGPYSVELDGIPVGENCFGIDRVVAGTHRVVVTQSLGSISKVVLDSSVDVGEGEAIQVPLVLLGGERAAAVTMGRFYICWLPADAEVFVDGGAMTNTADAGSSIYRSRFLSPGTHTVKISGEYERDETVEIAAGKDVELKTYTDWTIDRLDSERSDMRHRAMMKRLRQTGATVLMGGALAALGASAVVYMLGSDAADDYDSATAPGDTVGPREDLELYGYLFPAAVATAAVLGVSSISLYLSSTGAGQLEKVSRQINDQIEGIRKVREQMEKDKADAP
ncbi:MAG TPA: hypothetical protein PLU93_12085 [Treponemataceae bacterium]|nr:hypothetical protein [Treponemataceae bacterium]